MFIENDSNLVVLLTGFVKVFGNGGHNKIKK